MRPLAFFAVRVALVNARVTLAFLTARIHFEDYACSLKECCDSGDLAVLATVRKIASSIAVCSASHGYFLFVCGWLL